MQGQDLSTSGTNDAGVKGTSTRGPGIFAQSISGPGLISMSTTFDGIRSFTSHSSKTTGFGSSGAFGQDVASDGGHVDAGVTGFSGTGFGVVGLSNAWVGVNAVGGAFNSGDFLPALSIVGNGTGADLIDACATQNPCDVSNSVLEVMPAGDVVASNVIISAVGFDTTGGVAVGSGLIIPPTGSVNITGQYQKNGVCLLGCPAATATASGRAVTTYASMVSQPTIEDFGEAQLVNGQTYVHLDPKFANVVDQRANYLVFITPEGDANVLYVTQKSPNGFAVRESHAGRSTLMFSYRIVAKPFGSHEARLPMVELPRLHGRGRPTHARPLHLRA